MIESKWRSFDSLCSDCYNSAFMGYTDFESWLLTYNIFKEILIVLRNEDPNKVLDIVLLDEETHYKHDLISWFNDFIDLIKKQSDKNLIYNISKELLDLLDFTSYRNTELKYIYFNSIPTTNEQYEYALNWYKEEPDNRYAILSLLYAYIYMHKFKEAKQILDIHITSSIHHSNKDFYEAYLTYYKYSNNIEEYNKLNTVLKNYDKQVLDFLYGIEEENTEEEEYLF